MTTATDPFLASPQELSHLTYAERTRAVNTARRHLDEKEEDTVVLSHIMALGHNDNVSAFILHTVKMEIMNQRLRKSLITLIIFIVFSAAAIFLLQLLPDGDRGGRFWSLMAIPVFTVIRLILYLMLRTERSTLVKKSAESSYPTE